MSHPSIGKSTWPQLTLSSLAKEVRELYEPRLDEDLPYIGLEHIEQGSLLLSGTGLSSATQSTKKVFQKGDILFGTLRPYFRKIIRANFKGVCSTDIAVIRANKQKDRDFLFYFIANRPFIDYASTSSSGTRMPRTKWSHLSSIAWNIPNEKERKKIGDILSAYDDLIENCTRRIQILEQMAQTIYREWFVNFRFPGHEKVKFCDSHLGKIPSQWKVVNLDEIMDFQGGGQPPKAEWVDEPLDGFVRMIQIRDYESNSYVSYVKDSPRLRRCRKKDIMIARYGASVARICWGLEGAYNVALVKVIPKKPNGREFLRAYLQTDTFQRLLIGMSARTAQAGFNKTTLKSVSLAWPTDQPILKRYEEIANLLLDVIFVLEAKNANLRRTRDLLLPKLISGELDVSELDIEAAEKDA